jgi:hypothetical protein
MGDMVCPKGGVITSDGGCAEGCCDDYICTVCGPFRIEAAD